jgi:hypothetical protein
VIHFHGTPMTPNVDMERAFTGRHAMVSFEHPRQIDVAAEICQSVVLDNGAFSAWRKGEAHDFDGYRQWAAHWLRHPAVEWCVIPDVIDGDEEANDALLASWDIGDCGQRSVPVFHMHESLDRLYRLVTSWPRVALGSSGQFKDPGSKAWWGRMAEMMEVACDEDGFPLCKLHGLRMLDPVIFSHLPLASADSCNVARNVGIDSKWNGSYAPQDRASRAEIMMRRIEAHASARRWCATSSGVQQNMELLG